MKKLLFNFAGVAVAICFSVSLFAQTAGTFTFSFTPVSHSPSYSGTKSVMAIWIQTSAGGFVKTKLRDCCGGSTSDHLPTWSVNAGGTAGNCASANVTDATTGATLNSFTAKSIIWDGKGAISGTTVADGSYKVTIQETWNHGTASTVTTSYAFTKGPNAVHLTPANDANFTNIKLDWVPVSTTDVENISVNPEVIVYPNPTNGVFNVDFKNANNIKVVNILGVVIYEEKVEHAAAGTKNIDLTNFANGIYFVNVSNDEGSSNFKVLLNK